MSDLLTRVSARQFIDPVLLHRSKRELVESSSLQCRSFDQLCEDSELRFGSPAKHDGRSGLRRGDLKIHYRH